MRDWRLLDKRLNGRYSEQNKCQWHSKKQMLINKTLRSWSTMRHVDDLDMQFVWTDLSDTAHSRWIKIKQKQYTLQKWKFSTRESINELFFFLTWHLFDSDSCFWDATPVHKLFKIRIEMILEKVSSPLLSGIKFKTLPLNQKSPWVSTLRAC